MEALAPIRLAKRELVIRAVADGRRVGLQLSNAVDNVGQLLKRCGGVWFAPRRMWVIPQPGIARVIGHLCREVTALGTTVDIPAIDRVITAAADSPQPDFFSQLLDVQVFPLEGGGYALSFVYDQPMVDAMRELRGRFHKFAAAWEVHASQEAVLERLHSIAGVAREMVFFHERPVVLEDLVAAPQSEVPIQVPAAKPEWGDAGAGSDGLQGHAFLTTQVAALTRLAVDDVQLEAAATAAGLRDYQVRGVRHLLERSSALLADDMGLGKSRQAVVASRLAAGTRRVLVVCPASLRINWEREILAVYPDASIGMVGEDRMSALRGCDWIIANYERLGGLVREVDLDIGVMAVDEAHYLKEHEAGRTRFASLPWTPALMRQAEDRAYRLGQKRDVFVLVPLVPNTIDEQVHQLLEAKSGLEQDVVEAVKSLCMTP